MELANTPCVRNEDYWSTNRFTEARKLRLFDRASILVGGRGSPRKFGSHIDLVRSEDLIGEDLPTVSIIMHSSCQLNDTMGLLNQLAGPIRSPTALMKVHSLLERESRKQETAPVFKPLQAVFDALLQPKTKKTTACILCLENNSDESKLCTCGLKFRSEGEWNYKTA